MNNTIENGSEAHTIYLMTSDDVNRLSDLIYKLNVKFEEIIEKTAIEPFPNVDDNSDLLIF